MADKNVKYGNPAEPQPEQPSPSFFGNLSERYNKFAEEHPNVGKAVTFLTSRTWTRVASVIAAGLAFTALGVVSGGTVPAAIGLVVTVVGITNGIREQVATKRRADELVKEDFYVQDFNNSKELETHAKRLAVEKNPLLSEKLDKLFPTPEAEPQLLLKRSHKDIPNSKEASLTRSGAKNLKERIWETGPSVVLSALSTNPVSIAVSAGGAAMSLIAGTGSRSLVDQRKNDLKDHINKSREAINKEGGYDDLNELREKAKQQKIKAEVLKELAKNPNIKATTTSEELDKIIQETHKAVTAQVNNDERYKEEPKRGFFGRAAQYMRDMGAVINPFYSPKNAYIDHKKHMESANDNHQKELQDLGVKPPTITKEKGKDSPTIALSQEKDQSPTTPPQPKKLPTPQKAAANDDKSIAPPSNQNQSPVPAASNTPPTHSNQSTQTHPHSQSVASTSNQSPAPVGTIATIAIGIAAIASGWGLVALGAFICAAIIKKTVESPTTTQTPIPNAEPPAPKHPQNIVGHNYNQVLEHSAIQPGNLHPSATPQATRQDIPKRSL